MAAFCESGRVFLRDGHRVPAVRVDRLAEPHSDLVKLLQVPRSERGIPLTHELYRLLHPLDLLVVGRLEDAALVDVAEQLVSRSKNTPFEDARFTGRVVYTYVAGKRVYASR